jgi:mannan endo-1,4-beta-mannosidase
MSDTPALGVFPGDDYSMAAVDAFDEWLGGSLDAVVSFAPAGLSPERREHFVAETLTPIWRAGYTPVLTWEPFVLGDASATTPVDALRAENLLDEWAEALATWVANPGGERRRLVVRPAHEMTGWWYPWSAGDGVSGAEYVDLWNALVDAVEAHGPPAEAVTWLWCASTDRAADVTLADYYPGDDVVDWVGVDGYNWGASAAWSDWQTPEAVFGDALGELRGLSDRPLVVPEVGCSSLTADGPSPGRKSAWITDVFDPFEAHDVAAVGWFNDEKETDCAVCAPDTGSTAPSTRRLHDTEYAVYPAFERAATAFVGDARYRSSPTARRTQNGSRGGVRTREPCRRRRLRRSCRCGPLPSGSRPSACWRTAHQQRQRRPLS